MPWLNYVTITNPEAIEPFAEFGIILLLFSIGLELSLPPAVGDAPAGVRARRGRSCCVAPLLIGVALYVLGQQLGGAVALGLALALSSTALVLPMVGTTSPVGRAALGDAAVRGPGAGPDHLRCSARWRRMPAARARRAARRRC